MAMTESRKKTVRPWAVLAALIFVGIILLILNPGKQEAVLEATSSYLIEMILILPAVMVLMGLFKEWIPEDAIVNYLGESSGMKGIIIAFLLGSTPTGPLYIAFPIASELLEKKASVTNIVVFLTAWSCLKLPQELVEIQFLGWKFTALRLILTAVAAIGMGLIMGYILSEHG